MKKRNSPVEKSVTIAVIRPTLFLSCHEMKEKRDRIMGKCPNLFTCMILFEEYHLFLATYVIINHSICSLFCSHYFSSGMYIILVESFFMILLVLLERFHRMTCCFVYSLLSFHDPY